MTQHSLTIRLGEYISLILPDAHGHQRKAITDFVLAVMMVQSCCQAGLARFFDNFEAASKRLSRLIHNARLETEELALSHARALVARLPAEGCVRLALDWTIEDRQHLLVASLSIGRRGVPLYWRAYDQRVLKGRMRRYEMAVIKRVLTGVQRRVGRRRLRVTADRGFADVELFDLLEEFGCAYIIRVKSSTKIFLVGEWRQLQTVRFEGNARRRSLGRLHYCASSPRRLWVGMSRVRNEAGHWEVWYLVSNREQRAGAMVGEYQRRFGCEQGFRDAKRRLGFASARVRRHTAWSRFFALFAIALLVLATLGAKLLLSGGQEAGAYLRRVASRRRGRWELSVVNAIVSLLAQDCSLYQHLSGRTKLNLEGSLANVS